MTVGSDERTGGPGGGTGRRAGLKILFAERRVRVRFPSGAHMKPALVAGFAFFPSFLTWLPQLMFANNLQTSGLYFEELVTMFGYFPVIRVLDKQTSIRKAPPLHKVVLQSKEAIL